MSFELCMVQILLLECQRSNLKTSDLLKQKSLYISILALLCPRWKLHNLHFSLLKIQELPKSLCELIKLWSSRIRKFSQQTLWNSYFIFPNLCILCKANVYAKALHTGLFSLRFSAGTLLFQHPDLILRSLMVCSEIIPFLCCTANTWQMLLVPKTVRALIYWRHRNVLLFPNSNLTLWGQPSINPHLPVLCPRTLSGFLSHGPVL